MSLIDRLKSEMREARLARDTKDVTFFSTIIGELEGKAKLKKPVEAQVVTDEEVIAYAKRYIQTNLDNIRLAKTIEEVQFLEQENAYLSQFVPDELTENQIKDVILSNEFFNIGQFMQHMKQHYAGRYDGKLATEIFKKGVY